jgi:hypothetical protein
MIQTAKAMAAPDASCGAPLAVLKTAKRMNPDAQLANPVMTQHNPTNPGMTISCLCPILY